MNQGHTFIFETTAIPLINALTFLMDRLPKCLAILLLFACSPSWALNIYVSPKGSDNNPGTAQKPLATIQAALQKARELRKVNSASLEEGIHIILEDGTYSITEPILINSGDAVSPTIIEAAKGAHPIISGGINVSGWKKVPIRHVGMPVDPNANMWEADLPIVNGKYFSFRQLWVNGRKATRAKSENGDTMNRILGWNKQEQTCWIPTPKFQWTDADKGMEMFIHQWWEIAILRINNMEVHGDSTKVYFEQPESKLESEHPWPPPWLSTETGNSPFVLTNSIHFLDEPGEWYADDSSQKIFYWPRPGDNFDNVNAIVPFAETLVKVKGSSIDHPVTNVHFVGISFEHTSWLRPSLQGHVPLQEGMYLTKAYKLVPKGTRQNKNLDNQAWIGRPAPAVELWYADNIVFENCRFEHLASTGLDIRSAVHDATIKGNLFKDIGGNAILMGRFSDTATETHIPWDPPDKRLLCEALHINNNLITDAGNEDWGCVGIGAGYVRNCMIENNELENLPYTGISIGWGWTAERNAMSGIRVVANHIHHYAKHNYDCAGIYTLSDQGGTIITENYIDSIYKAPYAHLPFHWFYLYTDEGTSNTILKNNWTPSQKYLQNANGPDNYWEDNGPQVNASIKTNAGLEPAYRYLQKEKTSGDVHLAINNERPILVELVTKNSNISDVHKLKTLLAEFKIDSNTVYKWQDHYAIYTNIPGIGRLQRRMQNSFPAASIKVFYDLIYEFSKQKNCPSTSVAPEWDNILLTANLVDDKKLQQEYLDYHATQFEKWPEVSQGFCNANFQQLLVYKSGRQLIIVISIPKGESLDKLNPKTTENNPRMVEWNNMMSKYQEGIEGTKKGETWVFLRKSDK